MRNIPFPSRGGRYRFDGTALVSAGPYVPPASAKVEAAADTPKPSPRKVAARRAARKRARSRKD